MAAASPHDLPVNEKQCIKVILHVTLLLLLLLLKVLNQWWVQLTAGTVETAATTAAAHLITHASVLFKKTRDVVRYGCLFDIKSAELFMLTLHVIMVDSGGSGSGGVRCVPLTTLSTSLAQLIRSSA